MKKAHYKKSIIALLAVLMYLLISVAFAKILPLAVLQNLTNLNMKRRMLYDAIQAAAVIPFAATYFRSADFRKTETPSKWIPWGLIGVCATLVTIILPERLYAFWFYLIIVGCGEEFVISKYPSSWADWCLDLHTDIHILWFWVEQLLVSLTSSVVALSEL